MYPVSDALLRAVTDSHVRRARVTVLNTSLKPVAGGRISPDVVSEGRVGTVGGSGSRRTLHMTLSNKDGKHTPQQAGDLFYWNRLLRVEQGIEIGGGFEWVPVGTFMVDRPRVMSQKGATKLVVRGRDRWKLIDKAQYEEPGSYAAATPVAEALREAAEFAGVPSAQIVAPSSAATLGVARHYEEGDFVGETMIRMARAFGMRVYFDVNGLLVIEPEPRAADLSVAHHYREGNDSIMQSYARDLTDERFANHIVVTSATSDPDAPPPIRATASDERAGSPTSVAELGRRTRRYASPMITDQQTAQEIADLMLERFLRFSEEVTIEAVGLPYLDGDDRVRFTSESAGVNRGSYLVESFDLPLTGARSRLRVNVAHTDL